jgi:hypothetical protein
LAEPLPLTGVASGSEDGVLWISLFYRGPSATDEVLHVVCDATGDSAQHPETRGLYLERHDQSLGCYGGIKALEVDPTSIGITLLPHGQRQLKLSRMLSLHVGRVKGWTAACQQFQAMAATPQGRRIHWHADPPSER